MYISEIRIENFRCFGEGKEKFVLPLRPGLTALVGEHDTGTRRQLSMRCASRLARGTRSISGLRIPTSIGRPAARNGGTRFACAAGSRA